MAPQLYDSQGRPTALGKEIGRGGEGTVFEVVTDPLLVAKCYRTSVAPEKQQKLILMAQAYSPELEKIAAWPRSTLHPSPGGPVTGILMPRVADFKEIYKLYSPSHRRNEFPRADWAFLIQACRNTAAAFAVIHSAGHVIGDVNQGNIVVSPTALTKLIDCDSFHLRIHGQLFPCEVGVPHFTAPELQGKSFKGIERTQNQDNFGLALMIFHLLFMGRHPFAGRYHDGKAEMPIEKAICEFRFAYSADAVHKRMSPPPNSVGLDAVPDQIAQMFERAFSQRGVINTRPTALQWMKALDDLKAGLAACSDIPSHKYHRSLGECPWCTLEKQSGVVFFPYEVAIGDSTTLDVDLLWKQILGISPPEPASVPEYSFAPSPQPFSCPPEGTKIRRADIIATREERKRRRAQQTEAENQWKASLSAWDGASSSRAFVEKQEELRGFRQQYAVSVRKLEEQKQKLVTNARESQLARYLEGFYIEDAKISGIGPVRKATLASYGIETALDIERRRIWAIPGFGETLTYELVAWRGSVESRFVFNPSVGIDKAQLARLYQQHLLETRPSRKALASGAEALQQICNDISQNRQNLRIEMGRNAMKLAQARSDLQLVEDQLAAVNTRLFRQRLRSIGSVLLVTAVLFSGMSIANSFSVGQLLSRWMAVTTGSLGTSPTSEPTRIIPTFAEEPSTLPPAAKVITTTPTVTAGQDAISLASQPNSPLSLSPNQEQPSTEPADPSLESSPTPDTIGIGENSSATGIPIPGGDLLPSSPSPTATPTRFPTATNTPAATATPTPVPAPEPQTPIVPTSPPSTSVNNSFRPSVAVRTLRPSNLREGPGLEWRGVRKVEDGTELRITGYALTEDGYKWYQLEDGLWIYSGQVTEPNRLVPEVTEAAAAP